MLKLLIFHPTIAPYRIDFFNDLSSCFDTRICLRYKNLLSQKFDYAKIESQFKFTPYYLKEILRIGKRIISCGFWKHLDEFNPDIVVVEEFSYGAIMVLFHRLIYKKKYKIVSICDDSYNMVAENNDFSLAHKLLRKIVVPKLDGIILVESKVTNWYKKKYGKGFYFPIIKPDKKARNDYQRIIPLSNSIAKKFDLVGKRVFLFVGRLVAIKNVESAIKAFTCLNQHENVFIIVGDGEEKTSLLDLVKKENANVIFTGRLEGDELYAWYNIAQVFVLPSYLEPFGAVTNEALLAGCYSLISSKAGSSCLIRSNVNGNIFDPLDILDISNKMKQAAEKVTCLNEVVLKDNLMQISYTEKLHSLIQYLSTL